MRLAAIVMARRNSERLPRKNVLPFCGLPLIEWSFIQAKAAHRVDRTFLVTDDPECMEIAQPYGVEIIEQPAWQCRLAELGGTGVAYRTAQHFINNGINPEFIINLLPTTPLRMPYDIDRAFARMLAHNAIAISTAAPIHHPGIMYKSAKPDTYMSLITVSDEYTFRSSCLVGIMNWQYQVISHGFGELTHVSDEEIRRRIKKLQNYRFRRRVLEQSMPSMPHLAYAVEQWQPEEIDYEFQFKMCEMLMEHYILKGRGKEVYESYEKDATQTEG
jgi:CMP-N-acetylneuraminic acid synthetase